MTSFRSNNKSTKKNSKKKNTKFQFTYLLCAEYCINKQRGRRLHTRTNIHTRQVPNLLAREPRSTETTTTTARTFRLTGSSENIQLKIVFFNFNNSHWTRAHACFAFALRARLFSSLFWFIRWCIIVLYGRLCSVQECEWHCACVCVLCMCAGGTVLWFCCCSCFVWGRQASITHARIHTRARRGTNTQIELINNNNIRWGMCRALPLCITFSAANWMLNCSRQ